MKPRLDMNKIAKGLGAQRGGTVAASGGYFGDAAAAGRRGRSLPEYRRAAAVRLIRNGLSGDWFRSHRER